MPFYIDSNCKIRLGCSQQSSDVQILLLMNVKVSELLRGCLATEGS